VPSDRRGGLVGTVALHHAGPGRNPALGHARTLFTATGRVTLPGLNNPGKKQHQIF